MPIELNRGLLEAPQTSIRAGTATGDCRLIIPQTRHVSTFGKPPCELQESESHVVARLLRRRFFETGRADGTRRRGVRSGAGRRLWNAKWKLPLVACNHPRTALLLSASSLYEHLALAETGSRTVSQAHLDLNSSPLFQHGSSCGLYDCIRSWYWKQETFSEVCLSWNLTWTCHRFAKRSCTTWALRSFRLLEMAGES